MAPRSHDPSNARDPQRGRLSAISSHRRQVARARKLLAVLRQPAYRRALRFGVAAAVEHESIPLRHDFQTIIDAGANRGQFALFAMNHFPRARVMCFEPLPGPAAQLRRALGHSDRVKLWDVALGAESREAEFHISSADDSSSLLQIGAGQREAFPGTEERMRCVVQVRRLDELLNSSELIGPVLLKIDVQGGELGVLQGAEDLLALIDATLVEASFVELYTAQPLVDDVWTHLRERGFSCRGAWSVTYGATGACLQADLLFARDGFEPLIN
jgi:FkbM family methyltransferase